MNLSSIFRPLSMVNYNAHKATLDRYKEIRNEAKTGQLDSKKMRHHYPHIFQKALCYQKNVPDSRLKNAMQLILNMQLDELNFKYQEECRINKEKGKNLSGYMAKLGHRKLYIDRASVEWLKKLGNEGTAVYAGVGGQGGGHETPLYVMPMHNLSDPRICEVLKIVSEYQIERLAPKIEKRAMKLGIAA
jgi:hypothetical protein